jgi:hypothetical protein
MTLHPTPEALPRWLAAFTLALVIQAATLGYWAGTLNAQVAALSAAVQELRATVTAHIVSM